MYPDCSGSGLHETVMYGEKVEFAFYSLQKLRWGIMFSLTVMVLGNENVQIVLKLPLI